MMSIAFTFPTCHSYCSRPSHPSADRDTGLCFTNTTRNGEVAKPRETALNTVHIANLWESTTVGKVWDGSTFDSLATKASQLFLLLLSPSARKTQHSTAFFRSSRYLWVLGFQVKEPTLPMSKSYAANSALDIKLTKGLTCQVVSAGKYHFYHFLSDCQSRDLVVFVVSSLILIEIYCL